MRVIAGQLRGRRIEAPEQGTTRPTTDRVRESVFSSLYSRLGSFEGLHVLDAFAGSGALGIEALSRGAASCLFVERDMRAYAALEGNVRALGLEPARARLCRADVLQLPVARLGLAAPLELVLLDPPYATPVDDVLAFLSRLAAADRLAEGAVISYEHAPDDAAALVACFERDATFAVRDVRAYGRVGVAYMTRADV